MPQTRSALERWVFVALGFTVVVIALVYVRQRAQEKPLPILGSVTSFSLTNQLNQPVSLEELQGKVWLADIIFTRCAGPCPRLTAVFKDLDQKLSNVPELRFVSLTADPAHDTWAVLAQHAQEKGAAAERWWFLTGPKAELYRLAMDGLKLAVEEKDPATRENVNDLFIHSTVLTLVDKRGRLRGFYQGLEPETMERVEKAVRRLAAEN